MADPPRPPPRRPAPPRPAGKRDSITQEFAGEELGKLLAAARDREFATIPDETGEGARIARKTGLKPPPLPPPPEEVVLDDSDLLEDPTAALPPVLSPALASPLPPPPAPSREHARAEPAPPWAEPAPPPPAPKNAWAEPASPPPAPAVAPLLQPPFAPPPAALEGASPPAPPVAPAIITAPSPLPPSLGIAPSSASPAAWALGQPSGSSARAGFAFTPEAPAAIRRPKRRLWAALGGGAVVLGLGLYFALSSSRHMAALASAPASTPESATAPALASAIESAPSAAAASTVAPATPAATGQAAPSEAETQARDALVKLRDGLGECIIHGIGTLPGSSPALPPSLAMTHAPGYTATSRDWKGSIWICARFRLEQPMRFQVQWQLLRPRLEGRGVAWLDDDGDGNVDRALGFRIDMKATREPVLGEIGPIDPPPKPLDVRQ